MLKPLLPVKAWGGVSSNLERLTTAVEALVAVGSLLLFLFQLGGYTCVALDGMITQLVMFNFLI